MSDWHLNEDHHLVDRLCKKVLDIISLTSNEETNFNAPRFYIRRCWGASYGKGESAQAHNHWPATWSWCYYLQVPKGSSPLVFREAGIMFEPKVGDLVVFNGQAEHHVPPCECEEKRVMIAGNISAVSSTLLIKLASDPNL